MDLKELLTKTVELGGADLFIIPGSVPKAKVNGVMKALSEDRILPDHSAQLVKEMYDLVLDRFIYIFFNFGIQLLHILFRIIRFLHLHTS